MKKETMNMSRNEIKINNYKKLSIKHILLDYNGTLAKDGVLKEGVKKLLGELSKLYTLHIITADTFGNVHSQVSTFDVRVKVLESQDHTGEKEEYVKSLGASSCVAVGNGNNDIKMLKTASLGIAIIGDEGCATQTLLVSDATCKSIEDALELFLSPKRLIATLRK